MSTPGEYLRHSSRSNIGRRGGLEKPALTDPIYLKIKVGKWALITYLSRVFSLYCIRKKWCPSLNSGFTVKPPTLGWGGGGEWEKTLSCDFGYLESLHLCLGRIKMSCLCTLIFKGNAPKLHNSVVSPSKSASLMQIKKTPTKHHHQRTLTKAKHPISAQTTCSYLLSASYMHALVGPCSCSIPAYLH